MRQFIALLAVSAFVSKALGSLVGFAVLSAGEVYETVSVATLDPPSGGVHYSAKQTIEVSSAFCNTAFDVARGVYYVPSGVSSILTVALNGTILHNSTCTHCAVH